MPDQPPIPFVQNDATPPEQQGPYQPSEPNPAAASVVQPAPAQQAPSPAVSSMVGGGAPPDGGMAAKRAAQSAGQSASPTPTPDPAAVASLARNVKTGLGWHALMGTHKEYQQGPNGPVPVDSPNSAGQLFRSILAGAIMGMGAGAEAKRGGGVGSFAVGASAGMKGAQAQQEQQRQEAQQQFENQREAKKDEREATGFETEQQVRKAQLLQANGETLKTNVATQELSHDLHQKIADADKNRISTFVNAGVKPVYEDVLESQMSDIIKNSPGASTLDWRHTGVKTVLDANGNPNYEYTLSAYNPNESAPLSAATVKQWKDDGLFTYHPEYEDIVKPGKVLSVDQFTSLDQTAQNLFNQNLSKTKTNLELDHLKAQIDESRAAIQAHNAAASAEGLSIEEKRKEMGRKAEEDKAWDALAAAGNDPDKLTDARLRTVLARSVQPLMQETLAGIKTAAAEAQSGDKAAEAELPELWDKYHAFGKLASLSPATTGSPPPPSKIAEITSKYSSGMTPIAATNFTGAMKALQSGKKLSFLLSNLAQHGVESGLSPTEITTVSDALVKASEEIKPVLEQDRQAFEAASSAAQRAANEASAQEHPVSSAMADAPIRVNF